MSANVERYLETVGITDELAGLYSPEQIGVAERLNRTLLESPKALMAHKGLPNQDWAEAVECAAYIRSRTPTSAIRGNKTPLELWSGQKPDISFFKVFWCMAYADVPDTQRQKLEKKAMNCLTA